MIPYICNGGFQIRYFIGMQFPTLDFAPDHISHIWYMICGPYVVTLLNWKLIFERYMAIFVVIEIHTHKKNYVSMRLDYVLKIKDIILDLIKKAYAITK